jgi:hypothetical protein
MLLVYFLPNVETSNYKNIVFINTNYCMIKNGVMYFKGFKSEEVVNLKLIKSLCF